MRRNLGVHRTVRVAQECGDLVHDHPGLPPLEAVTLGELRTQPQHLLATRGLGSVAIRAPHRTLTRDWGSENAISRRCAERSSS